MNKLIFIFVCLLSLNVFGQDAATADEDLSYKKSNYQINGLYKGGPYLIYNCEGNYYTCVDEDSNNKCKQDRQEAIDKKRPVYPCAPLNKFPSKVKCAEKNYEVVDAVTKKRFCYPK